MKKIFFKLTLGLCVVLAASLSVTPPARASIATDWQKGVTIVPDSTTDFGSAQMQTTLQNIASMGANYVTLVIPYYQSSIYSTDLAPGSNTPTDAALRAAIQESHNLGLHVQLTFHADSYDTNWRANINPSNRDAWFANYGAIINRYADIAESEHVEQLCLGTELINMTRDDVNPTNTSHWLALIASVRQHFSGKLTYSAQWADSASWGWQDEKRGIKFWPQLDYLGTTEYTSLSSNTTPSVDELKQAWVPVAQDILNFQKTYNKPFLFGEIGYRSVDNTAVNPWDWSNKGNVNQQGQANSYQAFLEFWSNYPQIAGVSIWNWDPNPQAGGAGDSSFTVQNKLAQNTLMQFFKTNTPPPTPPVISSHSTNQTGQVGTNVSIPVTVSNSGGMANNSVVDVELYNSANRQIFQKFFEGINLTPGDNNLTVNWTPSTADTFIVKIGVFSSGWASLYNWENAAGKIAVSNPGGPPPMLPIDLWWPTNGATISGTQPFKAMIDSLNVSDYTMSWQVGNNALQTMSDNSQDWPHKESTVDVSQWNWNSNNQYSITFIAKNPQGTIIAQKTIQVTVAH